MNKQLLIITLFIIIGFRLNAQKEHCGTMQNLADMMKQDSSLKEKIEQNEIRTQEWLKNNGRLKQEDAMKPENSEKQDNENYALKSLCGYDNNYFTTIAASTGITVATTNSTEGSSGTNQNLPPYYALAYIMKT